MLRSSVWCLAWGPTINIPWMAAGSITCSDYGYAHPQLEIKTKLSSWGSMINQWSFMRILRSRRMLSLGFGTPYTWRWLREQGLSVVLLVRESEHHLAWNHWSSCSCVRSAKLELLILGSVKMMLAQYCNCLAKKTFAWNRRCLHHWAILANLVWHVHKTWKTSKCSFPHAKWEMGTQWGLVQNPELVWHTIPWCQFTLY